MKSSTLISTMAAALATLAQSAVVLYPEGYKPTIQERTADEARALTARSPANDLSIRSINTGCVQAHCGYYGDLLLGDNTQMEVYHNGEYIFYLSAGQHGWSDTTEKTWTGHDYQGHTWSFRITGICGHFRYENSFQKEGQGGWYGLKTVGRQMTTDDECTCTDNHCLKCTLVEAAYTDDLNNHCQNYAVPALCDYRGYCNKQNDKTTLCSTSSCSR